MAIEDIEQVAATSGGGGGRGASGRPAVRTARIMRITTGGGSLLTPARMVSYGEQAARSAVPLSRALPPELAVYFGAVRAGEAAALAAGGAGAVAPGRRRRIRLHRDITERALLSVSVLQPSAAALAGMSAQARVRFADAQAELLRGEAGGGLATYPYLGLPAGDYLRFVRERCGRNGEGAALFVLDMGMDGATMEKMLDYLAGRGGPVLVPLIYRGAAGTPPPAGRAAVARRLGISRMAFLACQVHREVPAAGCSVSGLHAACFQQGFDMAAPALWSRPPRPSRRSRSRPRRPMAPAAGRTSGGARFFSPETWRIDPLADALASRGMRIVDEFLLSEHNGPDRRLVTSLLGGKSGWPDGNRLLLLQHLARVHEAISSAAEFGRMRTAISERGPGRGAPGTALPPLVLN